MLISKGAEKTKYLEDVHHIFKYTKGYWSFWKHLKHTPTALDVPWKLTRFHFLQWKLYESSTQVLSYAALLSCAKWNYYKAFAYLQLLWERPSDLIVKLTSECCFKVFQLMSLLIPYSNSSWMHCHLIWKTRKLTSQDLNSGSGMK